MLDFDWSSLVVAAPVILAGAVVTLKVTLSAIVGGLVGGTALALLGVCGVRPLEAFSRIYVTLFRSVPLGMVLLWFFLIVPQALRAVLGEAMAIDIRLASAIVGFCLLESAFFAEIIRAGILGLPKGQKQAALSLGMTPMQAMAHVVLPQAFRNMLPIILTQCIVIFQDTSLVYVISLEDFFRNSVSVGERDGTLIPMLLFAGFCYWLICSSLAGVVKTLQSRSAA